MLFIFKYIILFLVNHPLIFKYSKSMKAKYLVLSFFFFTAGTLFSQNKSVPKSIIKQNASILKFYDKKELQSMQKGQLLVLYVERTKTLIKTLPYIALASKPGVTMVDLGIPFTSENISLLDTQHDATDKFLDITTEFQKGMLPYSDKENLIKAILFYESVLKQMHELNEQE